MLLIQIEYVYRYNYSYLSFIVVPKVKIPSFLQNMKSLNGMLIGLSTAKSLQVELVFSLY